MPLEEESVTPLTVFLWLFIAGIVEQEGGTAIHVKIIYDEMVKTQVPSDTNQAFNQAQHIRHLARTLASERKATD